MLMHYILDAAGEPVAEEDARTWGHWFETSLPARVVAKDRVGGVTVSTVFLGIDYNFTGGPPVLWETLVFNGPLEGYINRYQSRTAAIAGHDQMVARVRDNNLGHPTEETPCST